MNLSYKYYGEVGENFLPHGNGRYIDKNGSTYEGEWKNGYMNGFGIHESNEGDRYEGNSKRWQR